ncbi:hypothetical protein O181_028331 [Austropuccinia psidii MF-1]|uniref:SCD domain-containing protein n=1 Tax=Austropuccinia psidii MF-1 TaxID=1389203 RepID=A0A9Q3CUA3_9BASI|nr:hypothetical protein [Austropuccinia psidii MF-1]
MDPDPQSRPHRIKRNSNPSQPSSSTNAINRASKRNLLSAASSISSNSDHETHSNSNSIKNKSHHSSSNSNKKKHSSDNSSSDTDDFNPKAFNTSNSRDNKTKKSSASRSNGRPRAGGPRGRQRLNKLKVIPQKRKNNNPEDGNHNKNHETPQGEYAITNDNDLFNTIRSGTSAIEPTLEDWMEIYKGNGDEDTDSKGEAISQFINFVLRCCGCNSSIDKHEALDVDAVTDTLDTIQETFKMVPSGTYPLIVKSGKSVSKNFRKNLISLVTQLIKLAHLNSILYDDYFINSIQSYLVSLSSSTLRAFRHTSTLISLFGFVGSLSDILVSIRKELMLLNRKVELETTKQSEKNHKNKIKSAQLIEWEKRQKRVDLQRATLENYISEFFDGVFVHRFRDADPNIRIDCVQALGQWMKIVPDYFLEGNYLRYIGWVLTDSNKDARNEALKALSTLYAKDENIEVMQHFTARFKSRLFEMATGETDLVSRCLSINILTQIDRHGLLESSQRNQLGKLIYHEDTRVRKAASAFFSNLFEETLNAYRIRLDATPELSTMLASTIGKNKPISNDSEKQLSFKCLARLLFKLGKDSKAKPDLHTSEADVESTSSNETDDTASSHTSNIQQYEESYGIASLFNQSHFEKGRLDLAIDDLWNRVEILKDWRALCHYLLLDHTASTTSPNRRKQLSISRNSDRTLTRNDHNNNVDTGKSNADESNKDIIEDNTVLLDAFKLTETEETILVEVLIASLRRFIQTSPLPKAQHRKKKKRDGPRGATTDDEIDPTDLENDEGLSDGEDDGDTEEQPNRVELTRVMINLLPKLFSKFMTDPVRLSEVFRIPKLLYLNMYLDLRMVSAFEEVWETLIKQYMKQHRIETIHVISSTIVHVSTNTKSLDHINQSKITKLYDSLMSALLQSTTNKTDLDAIQLKDEEIASLTLLLTKIVILFRQVDMTSSLKPDVSTQQPSSPLNLIAAIANRGRLAHRNESRLIEVALEILQLHFTWSSAAVCRPSINGQGLPTKDLVDQNLLVKLEQASEAREILTNLLTDYAINPAGVAHGSVKQAAFIHLLNTYLLCQSAFMPEKLRLECDQQTQYRCAGFIQAEIEKFVEERLSEEGIQTNQVSENDDEEDGIPQHRHEKKNASKTLNTTNALTEQQSNLILTIKQLQRIEQFDLIITTFAKAIRCGLLEVRHSSVILPHFTRFSKIYDISVELTINTLNDSISDKPEQMDLVVKCLVNSLKESFQLYLGGSLSTDQQFFRLSRLLQSVVVVRGARMTHKPRMNIDSYVKLHLDCVNWLIAKVSDLDQDREIQNKAGAMFRGLVILLLGIDGWGALKIKTELDRLIRESDFVIPSTKAWDAYHHYLKRLISLMAKDPTIKRAAKLALQRQSDDESEREALDDVADEGLDEVDDHHDSRSGPAKKSQKPKKKKTMPVVSIKKQVIKTRSTEPDTHVKNNRKNHSDRRKRGSDKKMHLIESSVSNLSGRSSIRNSSVPSHSIRESSVVSVVIPIGPKRKRSEGTDYDATKTKKKNTALESSRRLAQPLKKRSRVDVVIHNTQTFELDKRHRKKKEETPFDEENGKSDGSDGRSDSVESEISLANFKRKNRLVG